MDAYIGQLMIFSGKFAPRGWALCYGQILPIARYQALYTIIGTTYGGDGHTTFALPDFRGRMVIGANPKNQPSSGLTSRLLGQKGGTETTTGGSTNVRAPSGTEIE